MRVQKLRGELHGMGSCVPLRPGTVRSLTRAQVPTRNAIRSIELL